MFVITVYTIVLLAARNLLCLTATVPTHDGSLLDTPAPLINISSTTTLPNNARFNCNGRQFGFELDYNSCLDAFRSFDLGGSPLPMKIGRRNGENYDRKLPWKWVSGTDSPGQLSAANADQISQRQRRMCI